MFNITTVNADYAACSGNFISIISTGNNTVISQFSISNLAGIFTKDTASAAFMSNNHAAIINSN